MNRRSLLGALAALPFVGILARKATAGLKIKSRPYTTHPSDDGIFLTCMEHPNGAFRTYALAGETVTCENGHPICEFAEHICVGDSYRAGDLTNWRQEEPQIGGPIPRCAVCGGRFVLGGNIFHIGKEWRDPDGHIAKFGMPKDTEWTDDRGRA